MSKKKKSVGSDIATGVVYLGPSPIDHPEIHRRALQLWRRAGLY